MRLILFSLAVLAAVHPLFAQLESNTITIIASRQITAPLDEAVVNVYVDAALNKDLDDISTLVAGVGIGKANLVQVNSVNSSDQRPVRWLFSLPVGFSKLKGFFNSLASLRPENDLAVSFYLAGVQASASSQSVCKYEDLVADARAQARLVAEAAGLRAGSIVQLSDVPSVGDGLVQAQVPQAINVIGSFSFGSFYTAPRSTACFLTVQFQFLPAQ